MTVSPIDTYSETERDLHKIRTWINRVTAVGATLAVTLGLIHSSSGERFERSDYATAKPDAANEFIQTGNRQQAETDFYIGVGPFYVTETGPVERAQTFPQMRIPADPGRVLYGLRLLGVIGNSSRDKIQAFQTNQPFDGYNQLAEYVTSTSTGYAPDTPTQRAQGRAKFSLMAQTEGEAVQKGDIYVVAADLYNPEGSGVSPLSLDCSGDPGSVSLLQSPTPQVCKFVPVG